MDGYAIAKETGVGQRINTIMQTGFFALTGILPKEKAISEIKKAIQSHTASEAMQSLRKIIKP